MHKDAIVSPTRWEQQHASFNHLWTCLLTNDQENRCKKVQRHGKEQELRKYLPDLEKNDTVFWSYATISGLFPILWHAKTDFSRSTETHKKRNGYFVYKPLQFKVYLIDVATHVFKCLKQPKSFYVEDNLLIIFITSHIFKNKRKWPKWCWQSAQASPQFSPTHKGNPFDLKPFWTITQPTWIAHITASTSSDQEDPSRKLKSWVQHL